MLKNTVSLVARDGGTAKKKVSLILAVLMLTVITLALASNVFAAGKVELFGTLTSIEDDGSVIIDEKGYKVSSSVIVQDYRGDRIFLKELLPSSYVHFIYEQATEGFVILFVKEIPQ